MKIIFTEIISRKSYLPVMSPNKVFKTSNHLPSKKVSKVF